jgi:hypothetical protein
MSDSGRATGEQDWAAHADFGKEARPRAPFERMSLVLRSVRLTPRAWW